MVRVTAPAIVPFMSVSFTWIGLLFISVLVFWVSARIEDTGDL